MKYTPGTDNGTSGENHRIGRELYRRDQEHNQNRDSYRNDRSRDWDAENHYHTGPSSHGAQDASSYGHQRGGSSHSSYNQGQNAHLNDHYGSRSNSSYRNEQAYINHGSRGGYNTQGNYDRGVPGNHTDMNNDTRSDIWRDSPGSRSRYKDDDYRYGSGSHNWYREGRYTPDHHAPSHDDRGFFQRMKDGWNDIMHSDDPDYQSHSPQSHHNRFDRERRGSEVFRDRQFDRGYESGPRWADDSDSGDDDYYNDIDRSQRYRR